MGALMDDLADEDSEKRNDAVERMRNWTLLLAFHAQGCRAVQLAIKLNAKRAATLVEELHDNVRNAMQSKNANYVLQQIIEILPTTHHAFIVSELMGSAIMAAKHRFGCRIMCKLVMHSGKKPATMELIDELEPHFQILCEHEFGHHVMESVLEFGHTNHILSLKTVLFENLSKFTKNRAGSYVLNKALEHCLDDNQDLASALMAMEEGLVSVAHDSNGVHVVRTLVSALPEQDALKVKDRLQKASSSLSKTNRGRRLLQDLGIIDPDKDKDEGPLAA